MDIGRPLSLIETLRNLLNKDHPLESVLPAFTSNVADLLRFGDRGRIREQAAADMIVLDADHNISDVMVAGIWHVRDGEQKVFGQFESRK